MDILDGTPLLDIKPYVPQIDIFRASRIGWLGHNIVKLSDMKDDGRFSK
jgi:tRNA (Thr-GGU) A37 N-methylase